MHAVLLRAPDLDRACGAEHHAPAVREISRVPDEDLPVALRNLGARLDVPDPGGAVAACRKDPAAVGAEGGVVDTFPMTDQDRLSLGRPDAPDPRGRVCARRDDQTIVAAERGVEHGVAVTAEDGDARTRSRVPES